MQAVSPVRAGTAPTGSIRDRLVLAATEVTTREGWAAVTMSRLAEAVGVSRQTVYNEIGTKPALAEAMILGELSRFLAKVDQAFLDHRGDLPGAIESAVVGVLRFAQGNALLHAVVSATHGADTELLPLLTTHAGMLMDTAKGVIGEHLAHYELPLTAEELAPVIDAIVRIVLSHVMQPSGTPEETAAGISWIARRVLDY